MHGGWQDYHNLDVKKKIAFRFESWFMTSVSFAIRGSGSLLFSYCGVVVNAAMGWVGTAVFYLRRLDFFVSESDELGEQRF